MQAQHGGLSVHGSAWSMDGNRGGDGRGSRGRREAVEHGVAEDAASSGKSRLGTLPGLFVGGVGVGGQAHQAHRR